MTGRLLTVGDLSHTTFSLLPDCLAARLPGTLKELEEVVAVAEQEHTIPGTHRTRVAAETMRDWLQLYRRGAT